jgi:hypothetical protein
VDEKARAAREEVTTPGHLPLAAWRFATPQAAEKPFPNLQASLTNPFSQVADPGAQFRVDMLSVGVYKVAP